MISLGKLPAGQRRRPGPTSIPPELRSPRRKRVGALPLDDLDAVRIAEPADIRPAAEHLHDLAAAIGLRVACTHDLTDRQTPVDAQGNILAHDVFGWPEGDDAWWRNARIALQSPIAAACRFETEPFWVNGDGFRATVPNPYFASIDLTDFEARALTRAAIVVPVHMAFGQIGVACFTPVDKARTDLSQVFATHADRLAIYARLFIVTYARQTATARRLPSDALLSKREVECLRWAALGKTDLEIGLIIARSRATVRFHIHNASLKLVAVNRCQTLFKAAQLGYITLG